MIVVVTANISSCGYFWEPCLYVFPAAIIGMICIDENKIYALIRNCNSGEYGGQFNQPEAARKHCEKFEEITPYTTLLFGPAQAPASQRIINRPIINSRYVQIWEALQKLTAELTAANTNLNTASELMLINQGAYYVPSRNEAIRLLQCVASLPEAWQPLRQIQRS